MAGKIRPTDAEIVGRVATAPADRRARSENGSRLTKTRAQLRARRGDLQSLPTTNRLFLARRDTVEENLRRERDGVGG